MRSRGASEISDKILIKLLTIPLQESILPVCLRSDFWILFVGQPKKVHACRHGVCPGESQLSSDVWPYIV